MTHLVSLHVTAIRRQRRGQPPQLLPLSRRTWPEAGV